MTKKRFAGGILTMSVFKQAVFLMVLAGCSTSIFSAAIEPIPEEGGFSGRVNVGAGWIRVKTNTPDYVELYIIRIMCPSFLCVLRHIQFPFYLTGGLREANMI